MKSQPLRAVDALVRGLVRQVGAQSATLFVADPFWNNALRIVTRPGVRHPEPLHGFLPKKMLPELGAAAGLVEDVRSYDPAAVPEPPAMAVRADARHLYGGFPQREGIRRTLRLALQQNGGNQAILFLNFAGEQVLRGAHRQAARQAMRRLRTWLPAVQTEVALQSTRRVPLLHLVLDTLEHLANLGQPHDVTDLRACVAAVFDAGFGAFGLDESSAVATFHTWDPATRQLRFVQGKGALAPDVRNVDLGDGRGVVSWVAWRRQPLLIEDLPRSAFARLYYPARADVHSELAVPVLSGEELLGVVNFESTRVNAFPEDSVRAVSYLANLTSLAARLARQSVRASQLAQARARLLELSRLAAGDGDGARRALRELAGLMAESLHADKCDIWHFDRHRGAFSTGGANYASFDDAQGPRPDGWSAYVRAERRVVWVRRTAAGAFQSAEFWDSESANWAAPPSSGWPPTTNERCPPNVRGELGMPIVVRGRGVGVVWIKFEAARRRVLDAAAVQDVLGWAAQVGLVLDALEHDSERAERRHLARSSREFRDDLLPVGARPVKHLDVFVLAQPHPMSDIGGDFHVVKPLGDDTTAFAIGDSQGHGEAAALGMIPLLTTFLAAVEQSRSTKFLLERLFKVASDMGIRGTALAFVISRLEGRHWLFASSAGHAALLVARRTGSFYNLHQCPGGPLGGLLLGLRADAAVGEDRYELLPGDVVIACTDGITEAGTLAHADFNHGRIQEVLLRLSSDGPLNAERVARGIEREARQHAGGAFSDDFTLLVVSVPDAVGEGRG